MTSRLITPSAGKFPEFLKSIESKWREKLVKRFEREQQQAQRQRHKPNGKPARYVLSMFPYPSGRLHMGHVRVYTSSDILTRYSKLLCNNSKVQVDFDHVINPMGFDSFGLPAENAAKERGLSPASWTNTNIRMMKSQLDDLALQVNWREATSNPSFYKWTQEIFLKLMRAGLVYKSFAQVNWDPIDLTVLADEQVDEDGRSWRSRAIVERRYLKQWFIKVNSLTNDIYEAEDVDPSTWRDVLAIQRNWIGLPCGWIFYIPLGKGGTCRNDVIPVFTKEPELFSNPSAELLVSDDHWINKVKEFASLDYIINPFTNTTMKISSTSDLNILPPGTKATVHSEANYLDPELRRDQILTQAKLLDLGGYYTSDRYRDWLISRQRFWGTPIPAVGCSACGPVGVTSESLPVRLPDVIDLSSQSHAATDDIQKIIPPLQKLAPRQWLETTCKSCGSAAERDCETFDTLFDSSWYFLRYATEPTGDSPFDHERVQPVWCYIGGKEHAAMHLFYARFITHFLHSINEIKFREPFKNLLVQGVVKSRTYKLDGRYIGKDEAESLKGDKRLVVEYEKMSKSKGNGVDPEELLKQYGVDATRFCLMSYANPRSERLWRSSEEEYREVLSYLRKVTLTVQEYQDVGIRLMNRGAGLKIRELDRDDLNLHRMLIDEARNKCAVDVMFEIQEAYQFRQYISALHVFTSIIRANMRNSSVYTREFAEALASLIVMLNPLVPHLSEELWSHFCCTTINPLRGKTDTCYKLSMQLSDQPWPVPDPGYAISKCHRKFKDCQVDNDSKHLTRSI